MNFYCRKDKMKSFSKENRLSGAHHRKAFSLMEAMAALTILAILASSVLVVINRSMASMADLVMRMNAFEVARDNMENLLSEEKVSEMTEYGNSEQYPEIEWQTSVEVFYESISERMWIQAVCSAIYTDNEGKEQTVELKNWITEVSNADLLKLLEQKEKDYTEVDLVATIEEAAEFAEVDLETIEKWLNNGMPVVKEGQFEGYFIKDELELYKQTGGKPTVKDRMKMFGEEEKEGRYPGDDDDPFSPTGPTDPTYEGEDPVILPPEIGNLNLFDP